MRLAVAVDSADVRQVVASLLIALLSLVVLMRFFSKPKWSPVGKHVFISGGSQGLGLALAKLLASQGAVVTICSRTQSKLDAALLEIQAASRSSEHNSKPSNHRAISADLSSFAGAKRALEEASSGTSGSVPDAVFCCAGGAKPGFFIEQTEKDFESGMRTDYWTALSTAHAAASIMARAPAAQHPRKIVLVSSVLGFFGLVGYSQYTPMKHAVRGLAESLRSELLLYNIDVHAYFPSTILSPGFEEENKTKPAITREIEGVDEGLTPEACAKGLLRGVQKAQFLITTDFLAELFRSTSAGGATPGNGFSDSFKRILGLIGLPIWRILVADQSIKGHRTVHQKEMKLFS
ncbi:3-dehydrosphinganine reductase [Tilletia horrida]|uniref:3-dehydrosphinganine reductase n=1 Tax=Tilletia horrida TaxID=155126 RepID=A0AAN6JRZ6_9BASI|nr:3-dehydrosphinganine reductase [Tilletia horrida]KAK0551771.1 3-dehydrosphinganine reductase [Tilletia horrida]KAK0568502.1 3-dehydrosphinganine reductase [Tilletia horrida]